MRIAALQYANGQMKHCDDLIEASQCFSRVFKRFLKQYLRHHHTPSIHCKDHICYSRKNNKNTPESLNQPRLQGDTNYSKTLSILSILRIKVSPTAQPIVASIESTDVAYGIKSGPSCKAGCTKQRATCYRSITVYTYKALP